MVLLPKLIVIGNSAGLCTEMDDSGQVIEHDLMQCVHCQATWRYQPGSGRKRGWCRKCDGPLCGKPACFQSCTPIEMLMEQADKAIAQQQAEAPALWLPG